MPTVDLVIPLYNEQETLPGFHELLLHTPAPAGYVFRYVYVNDGSEDRTQELLKELAAKDPQVMVIQLSRNFGHQAALSAGLDAASADIVITMDGDGQHPPSLVPEMLRLHAAGYDIVQAQRLDAPASGDLVKRATSRFFYRIISAIGEVNLKPGMADFRLLSRAAANAIKQLPEYHRFLRGMTAWIGLPSVILPYKPEVRLAGRPKYSFTKMLRLAADGLFSFSLLPLRIGLLLGLAFIALATFELGYVAVAWFGGELLVPGWTSLILILTVSGAINMILQGILGIYLGMIFREVKRRPVYLIRSISSRDVEPPAART